MGFFFGRDGRISVVRIGTVVAVLGLLLAAAGFIAFLIDQNSRRQPLAIEPYPGSELYGERENTANWRFVYYSVEGATPEQVAQYYSTQLARFNANTDEPQACSRFPESGDAPGWTPESGLVPYYYVCFFDRSGFAATQYTRVSIQPGVYDEDPALNTEGLTIIEHEQQWQASG